jgi:hypothetical protein
MLAFLNSDVKLVITSRASISALPKQGEKEILVDVFSLFRFYLTKQ